MTNIGDHNRRVAFWKLSGAEDGANEPVDDPWVLHKEKWAAYWGPIKAAEKAARIARLSKRLDRERRNAAVRKFRDTVCERMAGVLLHGIAELAEPPQG